MSSKYRGWAFERARESERLHWNSTWPIREFEKTQRPPSWCTGTARRTLGTLALALPEGFLHWHCKSASHSAGTGRGPLAMALRECLSPDTLSPHSHFCIARGPLQLIRSFLSNSLYFLLVCTIVCMCISMYMHEYKYSQSHLEWHFRKIKARTSLLPRFSARVCLRLCGIPPASSIKGLLLRSDRCVCVEQAAYFFFFLPPSASAGGESST